jgi:lipid-A-disaccharide synthase
VLALLPGSRLGEIQRLAPVFIEAAHRVAEAIPGLQVVIPAANAACRQLLETLLAEGSLPAGRFRLVDGQAREALIAGDVVLLASGTATLEAMLAKRPMVVGYRISPLTYRIVTGLGMLKTRRYSLPNVLANADLVPELMQDDCSADNLSQHVLRWFQQPQAVASLLPRFEEQHLRLRQDASARAADAIADLLPAHAGNRTR